MTDYSWDSPDVSDASTQYRNWYKTKTGRTDILRVVSKLSMVGVHTFQNDGKFMTLHCSKETDPDGKCPVCERKSKLKEHKYNQRFCVTVLHLCSKFQGTKNWTPVIKLLAWRFSDDKKNKLRDVHELSANGLMKTDIAVTLTGDQPDDEKFQKSNIIPAGKDFMVLIANKNKAKIKDALGLREQTELEYKPSYDKLLESVGRTIESAEFNPESFEDDDTVDDKDSFEDDLSEKSDDTGSDDSKDDDGDDLFSEFMN